MLGPLAAEVRGFINEQQRKEEQSPDSEAPALLVVPSPRCFKVCEHARLKGFLSAAQSKKQNKKPSNTKIKAGGISKETSDLWAKLLSHPKQFPACQEAAQPHTQSRSAQLLPAGGSAV